MLFNKYAFWLKYGNHKIGIFPRVPKSRRFQLFFISAVSLTRLTFAFQSVRICFAVPSKSLVGCETPQSDVRRATVGILNYQMHTEGAAKRGTYTCRGMWPWTHQLIIVGLMPNNAPRTGQRNLWNFCTSEITSGAGWKCLRWKEIFGRSNSFENVLFLLMLDAAACFHRSS